jgi:glutathione S-transferase
MAPHIALHEVGATFKAVPLSFNRKDMGEPAYLAINPEGKVPTLVIDGRPLTEVAAILLYLARTFPEAKLWPESIEDQAQVVSWMSFAAATLHPARARGIDHAKSVYAIAERRLADRQWAVGRYSIADIHLFRLFWRFNASLRPPAEEFPNLLAHHERMLARDAVKRTIEVEAAIGYELPA